MKLQYIFEESLWSKKLKSDREEFGIVSHVIDKKMEAIIRGWNLPEVLKKQEEDIEFKFDDSGIVNEYEKGYRCKDGSVKFRLYDKKEKKALFTMEFYKRIPLLGNAINLMLLYVHDENLRGQGVSSYYFDRLIEYAQREGIERIDVKANADDPYFKDDSKVNAQNQKKLEEFYLRRNKKIPVNLIQ
ncbi:hypothetical protein COM69_15670 [Bacillus toyonensis]|nr:hypothetical protein COM69_15670 [Bacillus toyonensis]PHD39271.1 hypothetical protein COF65_23065 [Bacillus toyonensis]